VATDESPADGAWAAGDSPGVASKPETAEQQTEHRRRVYHRARYPTRPGGV